MRRDSLFDAAARHEILKRLGTLKSDSAGLWGTMSIGATLCHMADQLRFAIGELEPRGPHGPLTWRPVQWFGIVVIPWVKGRMDTSPELLQTEPAPDFESDRRDLARLIEAFADVPPESFGRHPMFGRLTPRLWGILAWRHLDHHLRQFGA